MKVMKMNDLDDVRRLHDFMSLSEMLGEMYVDPKSSSDLYKLGMIGMVGGLDPYSNLFFDDDARSVSRSLTGEPEFYGIGIQIISYGKNIFVTDVTENSPAEKAGLKQGDVILKVNNKDTFGMSVQGISDLVKGNEGTLVSLEIRSLRRQKPVTINIVRAKITSASVAYKDLKDDMAYIKVSAFVTETPARFLEALNRASDKRGVVIDLRNNGGGMVVSALKMIGYMIGPAKTAMILKTRTDTPAYPTPNDDNTPVKLRGKVAVLINNGSASASEILAGDLKYYRAATLVGVRTFGKATAQDYLALDHNNPHDFKDSTLLIGYTMGRFELPDGSNITGKGVAPDVEVEQPDDFKFYEYRTKRDLQFMKALEILKHR